MLIGQLIYDSRKHEHRHTFGTTEFLYRTKRREHSLAVAPKLGSVVPWGAMKGLRGPGGVSGDCTMSPFLVRLVLFTCITVDICIRENLAIKRILSVQETPGSKKYAELGPSRLKNLTSLFFCPSLVQVRMNSRDRWNTASK